MMSKSLDTLDYCVKAAEDFFQIPWIGNRPHRGAIGMTRVWSHPFYCEEVMQDERLCGLRLAYCQSQVAKEMSAIRNSRHLSQTTFGVGMFYLESEKKPKVVFTPSHHRLKTELLLSDIENPSFFLTADREGNLCTDYGRLCLNMMYPRHMNQADGFTDLVNTQILVGGTFGQYCAASTLGDITRLNSKAKLDIKCTVYYPEIPILLLYGVTKLFASTKFSDYAAFCMHRSVNFESNHLFPTLMNFETPVGKDHSPIFD